MHGFRPGYGGSYGYGGYGYGLPYCVPSNLSPLAPPFPYFAGNRIGSSVPGDPFYSDPYFESDYEAQLGPDSWPRPSSPACLSEPFPNPNHSSVSGVNPPTHSNHNGTAPAFREQLMAEFYGPQSISRNCHPQGSSSRVVTDQGGASLTANERGDALPAMGSTPPAPTKPFWDTHAKSDAGQWKVGAPSYASFVNQGPGISAVDNVQAYATSKVWAGKSSDSVAEASSVGTRNMNLPFGRLSSNFEENSKNAPFDVSKTSVLDPASRLEKSSHHRPSLDFSTQPWNHTDPSLYAANPKYGSHKIDPLGFYPVYPNSSTNQIHESSSINNPPISANGAFFNFEPLVRPTDIGDTKGPTACWISSGTGYIQVNAERNEVYSDKSSNNNGAEGSDNARVDPSMLDNSEILEQFNPGVDSPCWKGASDSQYSLFGAAEAGLPHIPAEITAFNNLNLQGSHNQPPKSDNVVDVTSPKGSGKCIGKDNSSSFVIQSSPIVYSLTSNTDGGSHLEASQTVKAGVASRQHVCEDRNADSGVGVKDATLFESSLPSSRINAPVVDLNIPNLHDRSPNNFVGSEFSRSQAVVNSILVMSELLLSYCTEDFGVLNEQDHAVIQQIVENLDGCIFLTCPTSSVPQTQSLLPETANCSENQANIPKLVQGTEAGQSQASNTQGKDGQNACVGKKISIKISTKKDNSPLLTVPATDRELEQDDMTKGIQKILEDNFHEDGEHDSQGLLYKNLWLEAEAALCSLKYKERFARMKISMQKSQSHTENGEEAIDADKLPILKAIPVPKKVSLVESSSEGSEDSEETESSEDDSSSSSSDSDVAEASKQNLDQSTITEDDNASVMARFRILKSRIERTAPINKEEKAHDSVDVEFCPGSKGSLQDVRTQIAEDCAAKPQTVDISFAFPDRKTQWPFIKGHFTPDVSEQQDLEFGAMQSAAATNILVDKFSTGECSSPSSEWEHVLKDAEWPA